MLENGGIKLLRIAAYARVSTDRDDQANSFESQVKYFDDWITRQKGWNLVNVYADEGITGTSTQRREQFNQMIQDALSGKIDVILTKEVSRFARNTLDSISYTRKLKEHGVVVVFMLDGIDTSQPDAELRLTIMAALAQEESRKTSERVKWGQKRRMEQGIVFGRDMLGYTVQNGRLDLEPEGAKIVRQIFHKYTIEGKGSYVIARELKEAGIKPMNPDGRIHYENDWSTTIILRILRNEKYVGDLCQKKTWTRNFLDHKKRYNRGNEETVYIKNHHPEIAIISRELWDATQAELKRRTLTKKQKAKHSNRHWCSGKIWCGVCGERFVSKRKPLKDGTTHISWRCINHTKAAAFKSAECDNNNYVNEKTLLSIMSYIVEFLVSNKAQLKQELLAEIKALQIEHTSAPIEVTRVQIHQIEFRKSKLMDSLLDGLISKAEFTLKKSELDAKLNVLKDHLGCAESELQTKQQELGKINRISEKISSLLDFDFKEESRILYFITSKIVVYQDKRIEVHMVGIPYRFIVTYETSGRSETYKTTITRFDINRQ